MVGRGRRGQASLQGVALRGGGPGSRAREIRLGPGRSNRLRVWNSEFQIPKFQTLLRAFACAQRFLVRLRGGDSGGAGRGCGGSPGHSTLALTDRDGLQGIPRFLRAASVAGIAPIVGAEISVGAGAEPEGHVVVLAEGMAGYRNLCRLLTAYRCSSEVRRRPVCPPDTLFEHAAGLVCLTGAVPLGLLPRMVLGGRLGAAEGFLRGAREAFGEGNVFVELTDDRTAGSRRRPARVEAFARGAGGPCPGHERGGLPGGAGPPPARGAGGGVEPLEVAWSWLQAPTDQLYLKPPQKMERLFGDRPEALRNAAGVAERCAGTVRLGGVVHMPGIRLPGGETAERATG